MTTQSILLYYPYYMVSCLSRWRTMAKTKFELLSLILFSMYLTIMDFHTSAFRAWKNGFYFHEKIISFISKSKIHHWYCYPQCWSLMESWERMQYGKLKIKKMQHKENFIWLRKLSSSICKTYFRGFWCKFEFFQDLNFESDFSLDPLTDGEVIDL